MLKCRFALTGVIALLAAVVISSVAEQAQAQRRQRGGGTGGFQGFGGGDSLLPLLRNEALHKELDLLDDQISQLQALGEELRSEFSPERLNLRELSAEDRQQRFAELRQQVQDRAKATQEKVGQVLLPHQMKRLKEIAIQIQGTRALSSPEVIAALNLSEQQQEQIAAARRGAFEGLRAGGRRGGEGRDRQARTQQFSELRSQADEKVLAVLSDEQRSKFEQLQGEPFELPGRRGGR